MIWNPILKRMRIPKNQIKINKINVSFPNFLDRLQYVCVQILGRDQLKFRLFKAITGWIARTGSPDKPPDRITEPELIG